MRLSKLKVSRKPIKAQNGYQAYNPSTFDPNKQSAMSNDEFGQASSPQQNFDLAKTGVDLGKTKTPDLSKQTIDMSKSSKPGSLSPKSMDYSGLATTGMAMGVGAIEKQQASLAAVDKAPSLGGEMGKGALKGGAMVAPMALNPMMLAATGGLSALAVPAAAGIGAAVNYFTGNKKIDEFNKDKAARKSLADQALVQRINQASQYNQMDATNRGYSAQGTNMSSFYGKHGGKLMKCAIGGKIYKEGGSLNPVASDTKLALGRTHEQGGIKMSQNAEIEGGETVVNKGDHTLVVSNNLVNPETGRTFAKDDLKLAKLQSKYEKSMSPLSRNSLKVVQAKRDRLHDMQQEMNGDASDQEMAQNGGKVRPINILTKPVKTSPRPATHFAKDGMKLYGDGGKVTDEEIMQMAEYEEANKGGKGGGSNWGTNDPSIKTKEDAVKYYKEKYLPMVKNFPEPLQKRALQQAINTGDPFGIGLTAAGIYDEKGNPSKDSGLKDSRATNRGLKMNEAIYNKRLKIINEQYEKDPEGFTQKFDKAVDYHYANATQKGSKTPLNKAYPGFYEGYSKLARATAAKQGTNPINFSAVAQNNNTTLPGVNAPATTSSTPQTQTSTSTDVPVTTPSLTGDKLRTAWNKTKEVGEAALPGLQRAGKLASYAAPGLAQYYANKADMARQKGMKIPDAPQQGFVNLAKQNMEADRAAVRKQQADFNAGVTGSLADSQTAQLLKANMASKAGDALVKINQDQRNANIATANQQTQVNLGIDAANKEGKYKQTYSQLEKDIDLSRRRAGNVSELSANLRDVQNTNRQERYSDMDASIKVAGLDERGQAYLDRQKANPRNFWMGKRGGKLTKLK